MKLKRLMAIFLLLPSILNAQEKGDSSKLVREMNEVQIGAYKTPVPAMDVPNRVFTLSQKQIQFMNPQTSADLLQASGQVVVQKSQQGGGSPIIRGMEANKVLIVVDGVRMNNAIFRGGHLQNVIRLDVSSIKSTDVLFGPGSLVYGSDALGGVMHFATLSPEFATVTSKNLFKANAMVRYGTVNDEFTGHADLNYATHKVSVLASFSNSDFGNLKSGKNANSSNKYGDIFKKKFVVQRFGNKDSSVVNPDPHVMNPTAFNQMNYMAKVAFKQNRNINYSISAMGSQTGNVSRYDRLTETGSNSMPKHAEWYYGPEIWNMMVAKANLNKIVGFADVINVSAAKQFFEESRHSRRFGNNNKKEQFEKVTATNLNLDLSKTIGEQMFRYGFEANFNEVSSTAESTNIVSGIVANSDTRYPDGGSNTQNFAFYLVDEYEFNGNFHLDGGLRYSINSLEANFESTEFFNFPYKKITQKSSALSYNVGLLATPKQIPFSKFSVLFSNGYRVPNVDDVAKVFETIKGNVIVPNANLKPEYSNNLEFNFTKVFAQRLKIEGTLFNTWLNNLIATEKSTFDGSDSIFYDGVKSAVYTSVNKDRAKISGFYFSTTLLLKNLRFMAAYNYTKGLFMNQSGPNTPLDHIAPTYGKVLAQYSKNKLQGEVYMLFNGWKKIKEYRLNAEDNEQYATPDGMPSWFTINIKGGYKYNEHFSVFGGIENLLDTEYRVFASGINAPGRNIYVSVKATL